MLSKSTMSGKHYWNAKEIAAAEYQRILAIIENRPIAPDGYAYRLTESLDWELYELPPVEEAEEEATAEDYEAALVEMGHSMTKAEYYAYCEECKAFVKSKKSL